MSTNASYVGNTKQIELETQNKGLRRVQLALEESLRYVESILETVREPLLVLDADMKIISANRNFYKTFKVTPNETLGRFIYDLGDKQWDVPKLRELLEEVLPEKEAFDDFEVTHDFQDIGRRIMLLNARQIYRKDVGRKIILLAIEDITEHKRLEDLLTESEERYRRLFETARDAIVLLEKGEGKITHANPATEKMLGYTNKESIGSKLRDVGVLLDMGDFQTTMQNLNKRGILNYDDIPVRTKSGQRIDTDIYLVDRARLVQCNIRDITERKQSEEELIKSEEKFRKAFYTSPDSISISRLEDGMYISINPGFTRSTGYTEEEVVGKTSIESNIWDNIEDRQRLAAGLRKDGEVTNLEAAFRTKGGNIRYGLLSASIIDLDGVPHILSITRDITEHKQAEDEREKILLWQQGVNLLQQSLLASATLEEKLRAITDSVVSLFDADFSRIWLIRPGNLCEQGCIHADVDEEPHICRYRDRCLHLLASSGRYTHTDGKIHRRVPFGCYKIGRIASDDDHKFLTNDVQNDPRVHNHEWARQLGLVSFVGYQLRVPGGKTLGVLALFAKHPISPPEDAILDGLSSAVALVIQRDVAEKSLCQTLESLRKAIQTTIQVMVSAVEARDPYTAGHQVRSGNLACAIATEMGLPKDRIEGIRMAGSIHDIGKLSIPAEILSKPAKLTDIEFSLIKEHSRKGYEILKDVESSWPLAEIVYQHHERMNGSGYPRNLKGDDILMEARIMAVADVVEAMASHRPYRAALGIEAALREIEKNRGTHYDTAVADACLRLFREKGFQLEGT